MAIGIHGKFPETLKVVFELRYRQGMTYLDRCGRTINMIQEYHPQWVLGGNAGVTPQNATLLNVENKFKLNFSSLKIDLSVDRPILGGDLDSDKLKLFAADAENLSSIIIDQLGLADYSRIGCRVWYLFPAQTMQDAVSYLANLGLFSVNPALYGAFGGDAESISLGVVIDGQDRKYRIGFEAVERAIELDLGDAVVSVPPQALKTGRRVSGWAEDKRVAEQRYEAFKEKLRTKARQEKHSPFASMIDVDTYLDDPEIVRPGEFVLSSLDVAAKNLRAAVSEKVE
jgi:hypothetical protein